jgi:hypothetical protein
MKSTSIDTTAIACLGIINAVPPDPSHRVSLIGKRVSHRCSLTKYQTVDRHKNAKAEEISKVVEVEGGQGFTLISFIDSGSVETRGTVSPVKWQRTMSRVGRLGTETATRRERMKAQKRRMKPGRKKARAAMTMVSDQEPWTSCLEWCTIYTV